MPRALIVVDVNNCFMQDAPPDFARRITAHIEEENYDALAFPVFLNRPDSNFTKSLNWTKCSNAEDAELPDELQKYADEDNTFQRATYSSFSETALQDFLKSREVDEVVLCGIDTDACVLATAFSAFDLGYRTNVNFDLTFSTNDLEEAAQAIIKKSILPQDKQKQQ
jgi:nicotinamidase-related amidase